ncbi:tetratricopeptide repeat protein [Fodinibius sediminis]|uniref:Tetratricopeptide repeat-containing protein n=1 Tax=Fodinibius sediminis TaxID=1214077 RepID=A0A521DBQ2_9BACT|nr:tetratricopeptide repeat protein [Fodinibius sediminis]SMO69002.1 Tetratricopeptide repeat-containing protein [Fodinibius sediminis]
MSPRVISPQLKKKIDRYVEGELDAEEVDELWTELIHGSRALGYLKVAAGIDESDDSGDEKSIKTAAQKQILNYKHLSAALVLIAGVFFAFQITGEATESVQPITSIALNYYRSADAGISGDEVRLKKAIELANQGKVDRAVRIIDVELNRTTDVHTKSSLLIKSGSILYNAARYREALYRFERVVKDPDVNLLLHEKAYWYLGNTYFRLGEPEAAKVAFQNAYELDGAYSRVAEKYLIALGQE